MVTEVVEGAAKWESVQSRVKSKCAINYDIHVVNKKKIVVNQNQ